MGDQLVEFLRSKKGQANGPDVDWLAKKNAWIQSVKALYGQVRDMLRDSITSGDVKVETRDLEIAEEFVGTYTVPALDIFVGRERVEFRPMGVTVLGAEGRVDIRGERDVITLLKNEASATGWSMVLQRLPRLKMEPVNRDTLTYAFEQVMQPLK